MTTSVCFSHFGFAGMRIELQSSMPPASLGINEKLGAFAVVQDRPAETVIRWCEGQPAAPTGDPIFDPGGIWRMYRQDGGSSFNARIEYPGPESGCRASLVANSEWTDLVLTEQRSGESWRSLLQLGAGELIVRTRILFHRGIVFHAGAVDDNGRGLVFVGHSEAGKSTQVCLWSSLPGVCAMNDDRVAVRLDGARSWAYGLPWGGTAEIARSHRAPLSAIFVLEQSTENSVRRLPSRSSIPLLLPRSFLPYWDKDLMSLAIQTVSSLVEAVPVYLLRCRPDLSVVPVVRSVL